MLEVKFRSGLFEVKFTVPDYETAEAIADDETYRDVDADLNVSEAKLVNVLDELSTGQRAAVLAALMPVANDLVRLGAFGAQAWILHDFAGRKTNGIPIVFPAEPLRVQVEREPVDLTVVRSTDGHITRIVAS
jgi:hypothetical protein